MKAAVVQLAALAQETRLAVFLILVQAGASGVMQGELARQLGVPPQTLSFHLKQLASAGLIRSQRRATAIYYSVDFGEARRLSNFVSQNCCAGGMRRKRR